MSDSWGTSSDAPEYSPEHFYTRATDSKGHSTQRRTAYPPEIAGQADALIASRKFPHFATFADLQRDALIHRLKQLDEIEALPPELAQLVELEIAREAAERVSRRREAQRSTLEACLHALKVAGEEQDGLEIALQAATRALPRLSGRAHEELARELARYAPAAS